jgi:hypothetical protein
MAVIETTNHAEILREAVFVEETTDFGLLHLLQVEASSKATSPQCRQVMDFILLFCAQER